MRLLSVLALMAVLLVGCNRPDGSALSAPSPQAQRSVSAP